MDITLLIFFCVFGVVALVGYGVFALMSTTTDGKLRDRLVGKAGNDGTQPATAAGASGVVPLLQKVGHAAAQPFMPKSREAQSDLRKRLGYAGYYSASALKLLTGAKVLCLAAGLIGGYVAS